MIKKDRNFKRKHTRRKSSGKMKNSPGLAAPQGDFQQALKLHQAGRLAQARVLYENILAQEPRNPDVLHYFGLLSHQEGKNELAVQLIEKALGLRPDYVEAYFNLGLIMQAAGKPEEALVSFERVLALNPGYVEAYVRKGNILMVRGELDKAAASYRRAVALKPDYAAVYLNLGNVFNAQGRFPEAIESYGKAIALNRDYAGAYLNLGNVLNTQGRLDEAIANFRRAIALNPDFFQALNNLGNALNDKGKYDEAIASYRRALSINPNYAEALLNLGIVYKELGRIDDAVACYRKVLSLEPGNVQALAGLSGVIRFTGEDDLVMTMEALFARQGEITDADRIYLGFSLGKVFEDLGQYDRSYRYLSEANRLKRGSYRYSITTDRDLFEKIKEFFSPEFFASHQGTGLREAAPIFILGMLRSGSTLVEQILASHPAVFGAGEIKILENLIGDHCRGGMAQFPRCFQDVSDDTWEKMGSDYLEKTSANVPDAKHITDKMLHNFLYIGVIRTILPDAKVVHCVRDPMDNCFSIYKHNFSEPHEYAYDLDELGQYYNLYRDLMVHWQKVLPGFMHVVGYEDIVADQENEIRKLLEFCGLPWDESCLAFHKTERSVKTASVVQVRQPIYNDSVKRWKRYEKQLEPLRKAIYG